MKIICIDTLSTKEPILFNKPDSSLLSKYNSFYIPKFSNQIACSLNLMVKINRIGKCIAEDFTHKYYEHLGIGLNFIATDLLEALKQKQLPWDRATSFDSSIAISDFWAKINFSHYSKASLSLNEQPIHEILLNNSKEKVGTAISLASNLFTLKIGDILAIQLSESVPIQPNDRIELELEKTKMLYINIK